jgi:integrase
VQRLLTDVFLRSLPPPAAGRMDIWDAGCIGLIFRITAKGATSWSFRYRAPAADGSGLEHKRATIGKYPAIRLTAARAAANALRARIAAGGNPVDEKRALRADSTDRTFGALAERYLVEHARRKKRSHLADEKNLQNHVLPKWRDRSFASISRADVIGLVEGLVTAGKPVMANRVQSLVSSIFTFAMDAALVETNPCHRLRMRGSETAKRRVLSDNEIRLFWRGITEPVQARRAGLGLRLALLTGARPGEVAGLCRGELDRLGDAGRAAWTIPGTRTKNGRDHLIPLSPLACEVVLDLLGMIAPGDQHLLPANSRRRQGPMLTTSLSQAMRAFEKRLQGDNAIAVRTWKAEPPTPHDLRRTVGTRLAELRVPKEIRDRLLNHTASDVGSRHYNLHDYVDEKREALIRWSLALTAILHGTSATMVRLATYIGGPRP